MNKSNSVSTRISSGFAPGKVILIGEHAVVYGYKAILIPLKVGTNVEILEAANSKLTLNINGKVRKFNISEFFEDISVLRKDSDFGLARLAITNTLRYLSEDEFQMSINIQTNLPIGGFGSSTSLVTAIVRTMSDFFYREINDSDLFDLVCEIESEFFGYQVSGGDQYAVTHNLPVEFCKGKEIIRLTSKYPLLDNLIVINSGRAEQSTGELVQYVKQKRWYIAHRVFSELGELEQEMLRSIDLNNDEEFGRVLDRAGELLIELGVVTKATQELIKNVNQLGGHCKVSGAGAISGKGSGALVCFVQEEKRTSVLKYLESKRVELIKA